MGRRDASTLADAKSILCFGGLPPFHLSCALPALNRHRRIVCRGVHVVQKL